MFDPSLGELLVIGLLALLLVGPEKLPLHAATLGQWVRIARGMVDGATERTREELGRSSTTSTGRSSIRASTTRSVC